MSRRSAPGKAAKAVAAKIKATRERKGLSVRDLAEKMGVSHSAVVARENGNRAISVDDLDSFAKALGVKMRTLLP